MVTGQSTAWAFSMCTLSLSNCKPSTHDCYVSTKDECKLSSCNIKANDCNSHLFSCNSVPLIMLQIGHRNSDLLTVLYFWTFGADCLCIYTDFWNCKIVWNAGKSEWIAWAISSIWLDRTSRKYSDITQQTFWRRWGWYLNVSDVGFRLTMCRCVVVVSSTHFLKIT